MDIRFHLPNAQRHLFTDLELFLARHDIALPATYATFKAGFTTQMRQSRKPWTGTERADARKAVTALMTAIRMLPSQETPFLSSPHFWARVLESVDAELFYLWNEGPSRADRFNRRGRQMARNIAWYARTHKVIVWSATSHNMRTMPSDVLAQIAWPEGSKSMGSFLLKVTDVPYFSIGITSYQGAYTRIRYPDMRQGIVSLSAAPSGSMEDLLYHTGITFGILDLKSSSAAGTGTHRPLESRALFNTFVRTTRPTGLDALFFIRTTKPSIWVE